jgi:hypothetical protein
MHVTDSETPYWMLISVLFSSQQLTPSLAMTLHQAAYELYQRNDSGQEILGDMVSGQVVNLRKEVLLGTIGGPAFEAKIETERGAGTVRFILTRQGLEMLQSYRPPKEMLN